MSEVRMRLNLDGVRLEYSGTQDFFMRVVDPLVAAAAAGPRTSAGRKPLPEGLREADASVAGPAVTARPEAAAPPAPTGYRPPSNEFGLFVRQLGREAADVDKQVVAFAFFLWNYVKKEVIKEEEIAGCFQALGLPVPEPMAAIYDGLANRMRFLGPGPQPGTWQLTGKGQNYVRTRLLAPKGELV